MSEPRSVLARARTFLIVTLITVMVWLLAEARMVRTRTLEPPIVLTTSVRPGDTDLVVRQAMDQQLRTVTIHIEGSTAGLDRFARLLQNRIELRVGRDIPAKPGIHTLDLRAILRQSTDTAVHGLTITEVSPETITVEVDELVTRDFPVRVVMPAGVELDGAPRAEPAAVRVVAPAGILSRVAASEATVEVGAARVAQLAQGRLETIPGVVVELPGIERSDWSTQIDPAQVDVLVTIRTLTGAITIDRLPVQVLIAPRDVGDWLVEIDEADKDLVNIEIEGPADAIEQIRSGTAAPKALIALSFEDLGRGIQSKQAQIVGLPGGCRLVSPPPSISLHISRLPSSPASGDGTSPAGQPAQNPSAPGDQ